MNFSWFPKILAVVLAFCCYWNVVSSEEVEKEVNLISSTSGENSLSVSKMFRQRNNLVHRRENNGNALCPAKKLNPTIQAFRPFESTADAKRLRQAIERHDEHAVIDILTQRTYGQRNEIAHVFHKKYGYDYRDRLDRVVGIRVFGSIMNALIQPPTQTLADHLLWAMKGSATNEQTLIDILVPVNATMKTEVKTLFKAISSNDLRYYVAYDTGDTGELRNILIALIDTNRSDDKCVDVAKAEKDAATLRQTLEEVQMTSKQYGKCIGCCSYWLVSGCSFPSCKEYCPKYKSWASSFHLILASRSWAHLKKTFEIYKEKNGHDFDTDIPEVFEYWYTEALSSIYQYAMDSNIFFAKALKRDVDWCSYATSWGYAYGVARVFAWRSEIDLGDIAKAFEDEYSKTLLEHVKKSIGGYAKDALVGILR